MQALKHIVLFSTLMFSSSSLLVVLLSAVTSCLVDYTYKVNAEKYFLMLISFGNLHVSVNN